MTKGKFIFVTKDILQDNEDEKAKFERKIQEYCDKQDKIAASFKTASYSLSFL